MEEEILNYLNAGSLLKVLDNKYRKHYTGVTLNYITYDLLKGKYKKSKVAECLLKLHKENQIKGLYCNNVNNYVLQPKTSLNLNFSIINGTHTYFPKRNLHKYLETFIK